MQVWCAVSLSPVVPEMLFPWTHPSPWRLDSVYLFHTDPWALREFDKDFPFMAAGSKVSLSSCCTIVSLLTTIYCKKNLLFISKALISGIAMSLAVILLLYFFIRTIVVGFSLGPMTYLVYGFQLCPELAAQHKKGFQGYVLFFVHFVSC